MIQSLGLTDAAHTSPEGFRGNSAYGFVGSDSVIAGASRVFNEAGDVGSTSWLFDGATYREIGLTGPGYVTNQGAIDSVINGVTDTGLVFGRTVRGPSIGYGYATWQDGKGGLRRIGFFDAEHTASGGLQSSFIDGVNSGGFAIGTSRRYLGLDGITTYGRSAWIDNGVQTTQLGYVDALHTDAEGRRTSYPELVNVHGTVVGTSLRHGSAGQSMWLFDGTSHHRLGFFDADHTDSANGRQDGYITDLNDQGQAIGYSTSYAPSPGRTAWLYDGAQNVRIGFYDDEHATSSGSAAKYLSETGFAVGSSSRAAGGTTAWIFDGSSTNRIGFVDGAHTSLTTGARVSDVLGVTDQGRAWGGSARYSATGAFSGQSAWIYDGQTTIAVGLSDAQHPGVKPIRDALVERMNSAGQAAGFSTPESAGNAFTKWGWFYDPTVGSVPLIFSTNSQGDALTEIRHLTDAGLVIGTYKKYNSDQLWTVRAFLWSASGGFVDVSSVIEAANPSLTGFNAAIGRMNNSGQFAVGLERNQSGDNFRAAFLVMPATPGDFDLDNDVDAADFLAWQRGKSPNLLGGDDFTVWQTNFGAGGMSAAALQGAVPEPAAGPLLLAGMLAMFGLPTRGVSNV
jgi:hypothetical protein